MKKMCCSVVSDSLCAPTRDGVLESWTRTRVGLECRFSGLVTRLGLVHWLTRLGLGLVNSRVRWLGLWLVNFSPHDDSDSTCTLTLRLGLGLEQVVSGVWCPLSLRVHLWGEFTYWAPLFQSKDVQRHTPHRAVCFHTFCFHIGKEQRKMLVMWKNDWREGSVTHYSKDRVLNIVRHIKGHLQ